MAVTSWTELVRALDLKIMEALASRDPFLYSATAPNGAAITARTVDELRKLRGWAADLAATETAAAGVGSRQTYARPMRW